MRVHPGMESVFGAIRLGIVPELRLQSGEFLLDRAGSAALRSLRRGTGGSAAVRRAVVRGTRTRSRWPRRFPSAVRRPADGVRRARASRFPDGVRRARVCRCTLRDCAGGGATETVWRWDCGAAVHRNDGLTGGSGSACGGSLCGGLVPSGLFALGLLPLVVGLPGLPIEVREELWIVIWS